MRDAGRNCLTCGEWKPWAEYHRQADGHRARCRSCRAAEKTRDLPRGLHRGYLPDRVLDYLETHDRWMRTDLIADALGGQVHRTLLRLRQRGLVVSRPALEWAGRTRPNEWKISEETV